MGFNVVRHSILRFGFWAGHNKHANDSLAVSPALTASIRSSGRIDAKTIWSNLGQLSAENRYETVVCGAGLFVARVIDQARRAENEQLWNSLNIDQKREEHRRAHWYGVEMSLEQYGQAFIEKGPIVVWGPVTGDPKEVALFDKYERMRLHAIAQGGILIEKGSESKDNPSGNLLTFERYKELLAEKPPVASGK